MADTVIRGVHPLAAVLPPLSEREFTALEESIRTVGVLYPILIDDLGMVVDGRSRWAVCRKLGIECPAMTISQTIWRDLPPEDLIRNFNLVRRSLSEGLRAEAAIELNEAALLEGHGLPLAELANLAAVDLTLLAKIKERRDKGLVGSSDPIDPEQALADAASRIKELEQLLREVEAHRIELMRERDTLTKLPAPSGSGDLGSLRTENERLLKELIATTKALAEAKEQLAQTGSSGSSETPELGSETPELGSETPELGSWLA